MRFPKQAPLGNRIPESAPRVGHSFRMRALGETASRSELENWDTVSVQTEEGVLPAVDAGGTSSLIGLC